LVDHVRLAEAALLGLLPLLDQVAQLVEVVLERGRERGDLACVPARKLRLLPARHRIAGMLEVVVGGEPLLQKLLGPKQTLLRALGADAVGVVLGRDDALYDLALCLVRSSQILRALSGL